MNVLILNPISKNSRNIVKDFMYGCWCRGRRIGGMQMPPLNLLYVATTLKENNHNVKLVDAVVDYKSYEDIKSKIKDFGAVIILTSTNSFASDIVALKELKDLNHNIKTIIFGSHPTFMPEYCLRERSIDIIIRGEPEFIIRDTIDALSKNENWKNIKGIGYSSNGKAQLNEPYPFIDNLDELPIPDRSFLPEKVDYFNPVVKRMPYTTMQTSRGCPAKCTFCTVPSFFGKRTRYRSAESVIKEIEYVTHLGYKEIFFRDETFTASKKRNAEIYERIIKQKIDITWIANSRVDTLDKEQLKKMKDTGCHLIKFGVESGSQKILDNIHKGITLDQTKEAFKMCRNIGIDTHAHIMLGSPGETKETIRETIKFAIELNPSIASFGICTPYPGTELFDYVASSHPDIKDGSDAKMDKLHVKGFFNETFTSIRKEDIGKYVISAYRRFYFRPIYILNKLKSLNSFGEFIRLIIAGSNIFTFVVKDEN